MIKENVRNARPVRQHTLLHTLTLSSALASKYQVLRIVRSFLADCPHCLLALNTQ